MENNMKPIGYKENAWEIVETASHTKQAGGTASTRGARKDKKKYTRSLKHSEKHKHNMLVRTNSLDA